MGEIIFDDEIPCGDEIRLDGGWVDLISSEAKPKISSALADFILARAGISFLQEFEFMRKLGENIFFVAYSQEQIPFGICSFCFREGSFSGKKMFSLFLPALCGIIQTEIYVFCGGFVYE
ncbi:MAG: hypothetical protein IJY86_07195 [Clostridia bacterium]|nr:hypothetical protein [Clostridia bacterium]